MRFYLFKIYLQNISSLICLPRSLLSKRYLACLHFEFDLNLKKLFFYIISRESSPAEEEVILATAGYDHCIKFWMAHTGNYLCFASILIAFLKILQ